MIRLIVYPTRPGHFGAKLEDDSRPSEDALVIVIGTPSPLADGARRLIDMGYKPETPITMRHAGKTYDSFEPQPLSYWATVAYYEGRAGPASRPYVKLDPAAAGWAHNPKED